MIAHERRREEGSTNAFEQGEIFKDTKERLSKRTGIKGKQFEKIKFAMIPHGNYSRPKPLEDGKFGAWTLDTNVANKACRRHSFRTLQRGRPARLGPRQQAAQRMA